MHDVQVIGHVTIDRIETPSGFETRPGGTATYFPLALARLGGKVAVLTRMAREDAGDLLAETRAAGVEVGCAESPKTTEFENRYLPADRDRRLQHVGAVALPFAPEDVSGLCARLFHLGPLTCDDMSVDFIEAVADRGPVSVDVQGFVRRIEKGRVELAEWPNETRGLARVDVVKADEDEARVLTGEARPEEAARCIAGWGPREVLVTRAGQGALVCCNGQVTSVPAFEARDAVDATGCGDTFMAGYLFARARGDAPEEAASFGAAAATLKLARLGPFDARCADVEALLASEQKPS